MKAYLIDPFAKTITEVEYDGDYKSIYTLVDCQYFDLARFGDKGDGVFIDDEGLFVEGQEFFMINGYTQPLAGKGLVLGCDDEGESVSPTVTMNDLLDMVSFGSLLNIGGGIIFVGEPAKDWLKN